MCVIVKGVLFVKVSVSLEEVVKILNIDIEKIKEIIVATPVKNEGKQ